MAYVWMLISCFAFAWMGQFATLLIGRCDWRVVALARGLLAFLLSVLVVRAAGGKLAVLRPPALWLRSLAGSASLLLTFYSYSRLRAAEVLTLTNTFPIWVAVLSWPVLGQRPGLAVCVAAAFGVAGVALMQAEKVDFTADKQVAVAAALLAAFTSSVAMLGLNRVKGVAPMAIVAHFSGVATITVLLAWLVTGVPPLEPLSDAATVGLLLGVGVTATTGQACLTRAFTGGVPARVSVVGLSQIVFAMGLDLLFGGPWFSRSAVLGTVLVVLPTAWVMAGPRPEAAE